MVFFKFEKQIILHSEMCSNMRVKMREMLNLKKSSKEYFKTFEIQYKMGLNYTTFFNVN